jgi:choline dehydrogenase-like flavoprotein
MTRRVDAVVVGSGPGGAVTARVLAENGLQVLILEEGGRFEVDAFDPYSVEQMRHQYRNGGLTVALGSPPLAYAEGCALGGGSEVNSGLYHRPTSELLRAWSSANDVEGLDLASLEPWQRQVERELAVGPWPNPALPAASERLRRGAEVLGWAGLDVPRWARYTVGEGGVQVQKQTMARTYLPAAEKAGALVTTEARARRILRRGDRATGVDVVRRAGSRTYRERIDADHVFVCAGATQTPALLQRSGWHRNIGPNLSVHPTVKVVAEFDEDVNALGDLATYQVKEFAPWLSFGGSASSPSLIALALSSSWATFGHAVERWRNQVVYYAAIQSVGRGRVRALRGFEDPVVTYRLTRDDGGRLRSGLGRLTHLLLAAGARSVYPSYAGAQQVTDQATAARALSDFAPRKANVMTVHLTGTVPMGQDTSRAGADSFGRLHGAQNLRVNDASLLPWAPGINPQGTLMSVAHRNVDEFLSAHGRG